MNELPVRHRWGLNTPRVSASPFNPYEPDDAISPSSYWTEACVSPAESRTLIGQSPLSPRPSPLSLFYLSPSLPFYDSSFLHPPPAAARSNNLVSFSWEDDSFVHIHFIEFISLVTTLLWVFFKALCKVAVVVTVWEMKRFPTDRKYEFVTAK